MLFSQIKVRDWLLLAVRGQVRGEKGSEPGKEETRGNCWMWRRGQTKPPAAADGKCGGKAGQLSTRGRATRKEVKWSFSLRHTSACSVNYI